MVKKILILLVFTGLVKASSEPSVADKLMAVGLLDELDRRRYDLFAKKHAVESLDRLQVSTEPIFLETDSDRYRALGEIKVRPSLYNIGNAAGLPVLFDVVGHARATAGLNCQKVRMVNNEIISELADALNRKLLEIMPPRINYNVVLQVPIAPVLKESVATLGKKRKR